MRSLPSTRQEIGRSWFSPSSPSPWRLKEKLRFSLIEATRLLSRHLFSSRLLKFLFCSAVSFLSMDSFFPYDLLNSDSTADVDEDLLLLPRHRGDSAPDRDDGLYLVPYRWWKDANSGFLGGVTGVLFKSSSGSGSLTDLESEIVLRLRRAEEDSEESGHEGEGILGHEYAVLSETLWFRALKWHSDFSRSIKDIGYSLAAEDNMPGVFSIQIRLSVMQISKLLSVKIRQMDNSVQLFKRAQQIFSVQSNMLQIWDFSGQIDQLLMAGALFPNCTLGQADEEVLLELRIYGLLDVGMDMVGNNVKKAVEERAEMENSQQSSFVHMKGNIGEEWSSLSPANMSLLGKGYEVSSLLGLTGLLNLGNTCFMNSALQCMAHTPEVVEYFLGDYKKEINYKNPLGMNGELALAFGQLLRKLWAPGRIPVAPRAFKSTLSSFAPRFSGYNQHDSQEFLAFLLDGLHEDLNRVKSKPYIEARDTDDRDDNEVADEYWQNYLARNDSIIVDLCQGQYRSSLVCPLCKKLSVTFDPFMYLSLPLPSTTMRTMTLTVISTDGMTPPLVSTVTVPRCGRYKDLVQALSTACSLRDDEILLVAEVYNYKIIRFLDDPSDSLALIRDEDYLVAYRLEKGCENWPLVVFMHEGWSKIMQSSSWKMFGIPLVTRIPSFSSGSQIEEKFLKLLRPFLRLDADTVDNFDDTGSMDDEDTNMGETNSSFADDDSSSNTDAGLCVQLKNCFHFYLPDNQSIMMGSRTKLRKLSSVPGIIKKLNVLVRWSDEMIRRYDTSRLSSLPGIFKPELGYKRSSESVSLYKCIEAFLKEEPLGPEDMWYCPSCKTHRQAIKKLDLWRLPEILVIHLKRFSYSRYLKSKLDTYVDFPLFDLDLSGFIANKNGTSLSSYMLYAVSNHYGVMGGGHYTALVSHGNRWYEFDDSSVSPISEDKIKTSAAYVLFYRRVSTA
ncbi:hypothetical protein Dimus_007437 [Dionaea muscipula]